MVVSKIITHEIHPKINKILVTYEIHGVRPGPFSNYALICSLAQYSTLIGHPISIHLKTIKVDEIVRSIGLFISRSTATRI